MFKCFAVLVVLLLVLFVSVNVMPCDLGSLLDQDPDDDALVAEIQCLVKEWHEAQKAGATQEELGRIVDREKALVEKRASHVRSQRFDLDV